MGNKGTLAVVVLLALIAGAILFLVGEYQGGPKINLRPYQALGAVAAEETAKLLGNRGTVVVIAEDFGQYNMAWVKVQMSAFQSTLKKSGIRLAKSEKVIDPQLSGGQGQAFTAELLLQLIRNSPQISGVVIFAALPHLNEKDLIQLREHGKKIVVVSKSAVGYRTLLESGMIHVVIVARPEALVPSEKKPRTPRELIDEEYVVVTSANLSDLPP